MATDMAMAFLTGPKRIQNMKGSGKTIKPMGKVGLPVMMTNGTKGTFSIVKFQGRVSCILQVVP
jgi:hypothetical protein